MLRQMKQLGIQAKFMGGDAICTSDLPKLAGDGISNDQVICAEAGGVEESGRKALDAYKTAYKIKYGKDIVIYAPYTYDALMTMVDAMQKAKSADPKKYLPELAKIHHQGVTGMISFDAKGDIRDGSITLYTYRGAQRSQLTVTK
jgi:branched-chain amino acid transport system substrate-binding protein